MANYNVDLLVRASTEAALKGLKQVDKAVGQINARAREGIDFGNIRGFGKVKSAFREVRNSAEQVAGVLAGAGVSSLWGNLSSGVANFKSELVGIGPVINSAKAGIGGFVEQAVRGLPAIGDAVYAAGSNFDKFAQWFSALDPQTQIFAAGIAALTPQVFKLTRAFAKKKQSLIGVSKGFSLINEAGQKANGSLVNGMTSVQVALEKAAAAQQKFDRSLRGASLTQLNQVTRQARSELEGYWSMTGKAEKAAKNYAQALKAQKLEQEAINRLVKEAKEGLPLTKSEQQEAAVALAAQKELALAEKAQQKKKEDHERRMRKFDRDRVKAAKARTKIDEEAQRAQRLREGLMLGVGFPLLFGGGPGSIIGGGAGALLQSQLGKGENKGKGFGAQIALSAVGGQIDRLVAELVGGALNTAKALTTVDGAMGLMEERSLFSSKAVREQAKALQKQGKNTELATLLTEEYTKILGSDGIKQMQDLAEETEEAQRQWGILRTQLELLLTGPLTDIMNWVNVFLNREVAKNLVGQRYKEIMKSGDQETAIAFRKAINKERETTAVGLSKRAFMGPEMAGYLDVLNVPTEKLLEILSRPEFAQKISSASIPDTTSDGGFKKQKLTEQEKLEAERDRLELIFQYGEREAAIRTKIAKIKKSGVEYDEQEIRKIMEKTNYLKDINDLYKGIGQTIKDGLVEGINAAIDGTKTLGEVASNVFRNISNALLNYGVEAALTGMTGGKGGFFSKVFGRASGGPVKGGSPYVVGEKGPELFVPGSSGNIVPNHAMGGANVVVNVDASGSSVEGDAGQAEQLGSMLAAAVQAEIANQQRPGGLLARR